MTAASSATTLVIIRGNSGSGKSSVAREVQARYGRGCALIEQDYLRRIILREHDGRATNGIAPQFITNATGFALANGYHVVLEGIFFTGRYRSALADLIRVHTGPTHAYYLDVSWEETLRRHAMRPQATQFTPEQMSEWYERLDVLGIPNEHVIEESSTLEQTVDYIMTTSGLKHTPTSAPCPSRCPRCRAEIGGDSTPP